MTAPPGRPTPLAQVLFAEGFGTRRECEALIALGEVRVAGQVARDPGAMVVADRLDLVVRGDAWQCRARAVLMLNKPAGYECSRKPSAWPSVLGLLPAQLRRRGVQTVGRLDQDTTGLLLLTDDGVLIHRWTSPRRHVAKVYEVRTADPVDGRLVVRLCSGVQLHDEPRPLRADACEATGERSLRITLVQGKYHQVKRMVAAAGNRVAALHRSRFGTLALPDDLAAGRWRWVDDPEQI